MQTDSASTDEDIGAGRRRMRTTTRTGGTGRAVCFEQPLLALSRPPDPSPCSTLADGAAAIMTTAGLPAARSPMARADQLAHIVRLPLAPPAAQYKAVANHFPALGKRRHRGRLPTIVQRFGRTGGAVCSRRRSWMRIGTACATGGRGQCRFRTGGRTSLPSRVNIGLQVVSDLERDARFARAGCGSG